MKNKAKLEIHPNVYLIPFLMVVGIWFVFWIEVNFRVNFITLGINPKSIWGLKGVFFSPFIHSGVDHLYHNSIPLFVLSALTFQFYKPIVWKVLLVGGFFTGVLTWSIASSGYHVGASGIIYMLTSFVFFSGAIRKNYRLMSLSLLIVFLYGGLLWYMFPIKEGMSWEGHLSGFVSGSFVAYYYRKVGEGRLRYVWESEDYEEEKDPFMKHFDADGNFIENLPEEGEVLLNVEELSQSENNENTTIAFTYVFKENKKDRG